MKLLLTKAYDDIRYTIQIEEGDLIVLGNLTEWDKAKITQLSDSPKISDRILAIRIFALALEKAAEERGGAALPPKG